MNSFGLDDRERDLIAGVFHRHPEVDEVRIFGSRAKGNYEKHSDIDLAFWGRVNGNCWRDWLANWTNCHFRTLST
jgi:hypothetical protein